MKKMLKKSNIAPTLVALLPFAVSLTFYARLPERVAIHFDFSGLPDNFAPRAVAAFLLPTAMLAGHLYTLFRLANEPKQRAMPDAIVTLMPWAIPVLSVVMQTAVVGYAVFDKVDMTFWTSLLCGAGMVVIGNYLPKCRHNYTFGIKLPWTLASEDNWNVTHRAAGYLYVGFGLLSMLNAFTGTAWMILIAAVVCALVPFLVSYGYYRKHGGAVPEE